MSESANASTSGSDKAKLHSLIHAQTIDGKKSFWSATLETLGMADGGKTRDTDIVVESLDDAVSALQMMLEEQNLLENHVKWTFPHTPFADFNAKPTDLLVAFAKWAREKESEAEEASTTATTKNSAPAIVPVEWSKIRINASKAFRRLTSYVDWVDDQVTKKNKLGLFTQPLDVAHLDYATVVAQGSKVSHDAYGRIVWWLDLEAMDMKAIHEKRITVTNLVRYMVWLAHLLLFDSGAQDYGFVFVENLAHVSFFQAATLVPMEVSTAIDRLTMGVLPLRMKQMVVLGADRWMHLVMTLFKPFMSQKLRQRIRMIGRHEDTQAIVAQLLGGVDSILPGSCCGLHDGRCTEEIIFGTYFLKQHQAALNEKAAKENAATATTSACMKEEDEAVC